MASHPRADVPLRESGSCNQESYPNIAPATKRTYIDTSKVLCHENWKSSSENLCKSIAPMIQKNFWHIVKYVGMWQSATPTTPNDIVRHFKPPRVTTFAAVTKGTAVSSPRGRAADGCGRLRTQKQGWANMSQHPDPQSKTRTLCYVFRKKWIIYNLGAFRTLFNLGVFRTRFFVDK